MKILRKQTAVLLLAPLVALCTAFVLCRIYDLPNPIYIALMATNALAPTDSHKLFDATAIPRPQNARPFESENRTLNMMVNWRAGETIPLQNFLALTKTKAFLVVHDDRLVAEAYFHGKSKDTLFPSFSLSKAVIASLVGVAVSKNILSLDDKVGKYLIEPDISKEYSSVTVRDLLNMRSGIDVDENYFSVFAPVVKMYLTTDMNTFLRGVQGTRFDPGSRFEYRSVDSQILGKVLSTAWGRPLSELVRQQLWEPLGAEAGATWSVDSSTHSVEKAFCCFNATARDFAKIGALYLNQGARNGEQIFSPDWVQEQHVPTGVDQKRSLGYRNHWWTPLDNKEDRDFFAVGIHGQFIYVNPGKKVVIVKLGDHEVERDILLTVAMLREVAKEVSNQVGSKAANLSGISASNQ